MKRGRPLKFGRSAELIALTLPRDVVSWLRTINDDPAWAIVQLFERNNAKRNRVQELPRRSAELVDVGHRRALIVIDQESFTTLPGVAMIPLANGRSFLALEPGRGMADLEVAVLDRLEERGLAAGERDALDELRRQLREWRQDSGIGFHTRSIIVAERQKSRRTATVVSEGR